MNLWAIALPSIEAAGDTSSFPVARRDIGIALAADALLAAGLIERLTELGVAIAGSGRIELPPGELSGDPITDLGRHGARLAAEIGRAHDAEAVPLMVGGTCNHVCGILAGLQQIYGPASRIGVVWFDAHGDCNTPRTSLSGMTWGMPLGVALGLSYPEWREGAGMAVVLPTNRLVFAGARSLDPWERDFITASDAVLSQFDEEQPGPTVEEAVLELTGRVDHLYIHVDMDVLERASIPNMRLAEASGPTPERAVKAISAAMATGKVRAYSVVSFDPSGSGGERSLDSAMTLILQGAAAWNRSSAQPPA